MSTRKVYRYNQKAGVILNDFCDLEINQFDLFSDEQSKIKSQQLMNTIDKINKFSSSKLFFASQGIKGQWHMKQELLSPRYTTRIEDLKKVYL